MAKMSIRSLPSRMRTRIFGYGQPYHLNPYYHYPVLHDFANAAVVITNRVYLQPIIPHFPLTTNAVVAPMNTVSAGNRTAGIYGPGTVPATIIPDGLPLIVASASGAKAGVQQKDHVTTAATRLLAGRLYYLAWVSDENTSNLRMTSAGVSQNTLESRSYDIGLYANFAVGNPAADPCPVTAYRTGPTLFIRVTSVP